MSEQSPEAATALETMRAEMEAMRAEMATLKARPAELPPPMSALPRAEAAEFVPSSQMQALLGLAHNHPPAGPISETAARMMGSPGPHCIIYNELALYHIQ